jgi:DNA-binding protein HU-beta
LRRLAGAGHIVAPPVDQSPPSRQENAVNRQDMIHAVARKLAKSKAAAAEIVDLFFATDGLIATELKKGGRVQISGFGNFEPRKRAARKGRNPATNEVMSIKASVVPAFRPGKALKDTVNRRRTG